MKHTFGHITDRGGNSWMNWLLMPLLLLCLSACSSADDNNVATSQTEDTSKTKLYIYVYAPQEAQSSRAYDGDVNPITNESSVYSLQIWVFGHTSHNLLGYYTSTGTPGLSKDTPYELIQLTIDETYAETEGRENVDVYVAANVENSNCNVTLGENITQAQLEASLIEKTTVDPFGVTSPVSIVPADVGLPMTGVLRNIPVTGTAPVLRLDDGGEIATVYLVRTISKLRFAFSRETGGETLTINSIKLNTEMLPIAEYLFMSAGAPYDRHTCHIKTESGYDATTPNLLSAPLTEIADNADPVIYSWGYDELIPAEYEARIETAAASGNLTQRYFYLRESDKLLQGMVDAGGFSRNHVWTIYSYLAESKLKVIVAEVAPWRQTEQSYEFYNW